MKLRIQHRTTYRYAEKVVFGPHRMMLRPREGHDIQIEQSVLHVTPAHRINWIRDVYGNSIAVVNFNEPASELMIYSDLLLNHFEISPFNLFGSNFPPLAAALVVSVSLFSEIPRCLRRGQPLEVSRAVSLLAR